MGGAFTRVGNDSHFRLFQKLKHGSRLDLPGSRNNHTCHLRVHWPGERGGVECIRGECWALVQRIVSSPPFQKSARLRELLEYLAERTLHHHGQDLTEQQIGNALFNKPAGYDPLEDSSVRVHARQLRLKLHEYFDEEGRNEPLILTIPKGSYSLIL